VDTRCAISAAPYVQPPDTRTARTEALPDWAAAS
jgi:hypothetical protein